VAPPSRSGDGVPVAHVEFLAISMRCQWPLAPGSPYHEKRSGPAQMPSRSRLRRRHAALLQQMEGTLRGGAPLLSIPASLSQAAGVAAEFFDFRPLQD